MDDFLRQKEIEMNNFFDEFKHQSLSDEKCDLLNNFYSELYSNMRSNVLWNGEKPFNFLYIYDKVCFFSEILKERKNTIKKALQRHIISKVYENAFYPNGDGDRDRDR